MNDIITNLAVADETSVMIVLLLPLTAGMLVSQTNPYHALVIRGIVGAIAAMVYALFGAADVALTEAFVGTMLSMMLYVVAVRSSMTMRVGCLQAFVTKESETPYHSLLERLNVALKQHFLRVEVITYDTIQALEQAMHEEDIHTMITSTDSTSLPLEHSFQVKTRLERLFSLLNHPSITAIAPVSLHCSELLLEREIQGDG